MNRLLRDRDVRRLACILVGCAVAWQLWRWTPMLRPWVTTWLTEGEEPPPGKSSGAAADPWAAFTPQTLLPLVLYVAGAVVVLLLVSRIRHRPGFRWTTVGSLQVLSLLIGFAVSGWQQVLGLENVQGVDHWFANPRDVGLEWLAAPLSSCLLTGGYGRRLGTSRRRSRAGLTDRQIWLAVLVPAALVAGVVACAVPFLSGVMLVPVVPMLALYCVGMWFLLHAVRGLPGLRADLLVLINSPAAGRGSWPQLADAAALVCLRCVFPTVLWRRHHPEWRSLRPAADRRVPDRAVHLSEAAQSRCEPAVSLEIPIGWGRLWLLSASVCRFLNR